MSEIKPDVVISKTEYMMPDKLGMHISSDPRFKLLLKANELGLQGKKLVSITYWPRFITNDVNNTYNEVEEFFFKTEDLK